MDYSDDEILQIPRDITTIKYDDPYLANIAKNKIKYIRLHSGVKEIGNFAFAGFENLEHIELNDGLIKIGDRAFTWCKSLQEVHFPNSVVDVGKSAFAYCGALQAITMDENICYSDKNCNCLFDKRKSTIVVACKNTKIPDGTLFYSHCISEVSGLKSVVIPEGVEIINCNAIYYCPDLEYIELPKSIKEIQSGALAHLPKLQEIIIDKQNHTYESRANAMIIEKIKDGADKTITGKGVPAKALVFAGKNKEIPEDVYYIKYGAFENRDDLVSVFIPKNVTRISYAAFYNCKNISEIKVHPKNPIYTDSVSKTKVLRSFFEQGKQNNNLIIEKQTSAVVLGCKNSILFEGIKEINSYAFMGAKIEKLEMPASIEKIGYEVFKDSEIGCLDFSKVEHSVDIKGTSIKASIGQLRLSKGTVFINMEAQDLISNAFCEAKIKEFIVDPENAEYADMGHTALVKKSDMTLIALAQDKPIPEGVQNLGDSCMQGIELKNIVLPNSIKSIGNYALAYSRVENISLNDGLERIGDKVFYNCFNLKSLHLPKSVKYMGRDALPPQALGQNFSFYSTTTIGIKERGLTDSIVHYPNADLRLGNVKLYDMTPHGMAFKYIVHDGKDTMIAFADISGNLVNVEYQTLMRKSTPFNRLQQLKLDDMYKLNEWYKRVDKPNYKMPKYFIISGMPISEIENFDLNNNRKNWGILTSVDKCKDATDEQMASLFELAHALGVFSSSGAESKEATDYILQNILSEYSMDEIHSMFSGFDSFSTPYDKDFAQFFMKYFDGPMFMSIQNENTLEWHSLLASCHNDFRLVKQTYPDKKVITRQNNERLEPKHAIGVLMKRSYDGVDEKTAGLAQYLSMYGYTQKQFDILKEWYNIGRRTKCDFEPQSRQVGNVTYEVLSKDNPMGAVLGNMTNCCQVLGGAGSTCLRYGMTQPNSTFIVFRGRGRVLGQAWVWYDESNQQITLDNIEVPYTAQQFINADKHIKKDILNCLTEMSKDLVDSFNKDGKKVKRVTVGLGYNDFSSVLANNFEKISAPSTLSKYSGYTDAKAQLLLYSVNGKRHFAHKQIDKIR